MAWGQKIYISGNRISSYLVVKAFLFNITKFINSVFIPYDFKLVLIKQFLRYRNGNNSSQKQYADLAFFGCLAL